MNITSGRALARVLFAVLATAPALVTQAANHDAFFEQQRQITDGYYPQYTVQPSARRESPATARQVAENRWFELERARGSGNVKPVPFPPPPAPETALASNSPSESATQLAQGNQ